MLILPASVRLFLAREPVDMRKGFDSLANLVREHLGGDPLSGHLFIFRSRRGDRLKVLYWHDGGLCQWYKVRSAWWSLDAACSAESRQFAIAV